MGGRTYEDAAAYVRAAARFGIHPSLDTIRELTSALGQPQSAFRVVQVGGTNGKTSVARMTAALLRSQGERVGLFTSPTMGRLSDQIEVDGRVVTREVYAAAIDAVAKAAAERDVEPTEFEITTAAALWALREACVSWAVLEVGMGGRWDATSVARADVAVVTGVDIDHAQYLGTTREAIAAEKAQIIRSGSRAVLGPGVAGVLEVFLARAGEVDAPHATVALSPTAGDAVFEVVRTPTAPGGETELAVTTTRDRYDRIVVRAPSYQAANAAVALVAAEAALARRLDANRGREALEGVRFPGRFELLSTDPLVICDGAHNPAAADVLAGAVEECMADRKLAIVLGVLADKDAEGIVAALAPIAAGFVCTRSRSDRAVEPEDLAPIVERVTGASPQVAPGVAAALDAAGAQSLPILACGSLTVAAEARRALRKEWAE